MAAETVTVMFTDLVASTELLVRVGQTAGEALRREFFEILRAGVAAHGGNEVKNLGDGLMLTFPSASAAVAGGVSLQKALAIRNRRSGEPLGVRVGISVGDADEVDGDYFGISVVEAARLCSAAEGGQIFVTNTVVLLARDRAGDLFRPVGPLDLKGLDQSLEVAEVDWLSQGDNSDVDLELPLRLARMASGSFVGRAAECEALDVASKESEALGQVHVMLISGEPGVGKSTLAARVAERSHGQGAVVALGSCTEETTVAFRPWRELLAPLAALMSDVERNLHIAANGHALGVLVPKVVDRSTGPVLSADEDPESVRYALFAAVVDVLSRVSTTWPVVILLDDLHWADAASLALLRHVAKSPQVMRVLIIGTFREADVVAGSTMAAALADLHREQAVERIRLRGLDDLGVLELMEDLAGGELPAEAVDLRDALLAETDGNPFFVIELLRHFMEAGIVYMDAEGRWAAASDLLGGGLPVSVREVIGERVARLGERTHRLLLSASVIGREFDLDLLSAVDGRGGGEVLDDIETATEVGLLTDLASGRFSFAHALIQRTLYEEIQPTRRAWIHREVAEKIEARTGDDTTEVAAVLARHWGAATVPEDPLRVVEYSRQAGDQALRELAPEQAAEWFSQGLDLLDRSGREEPALHCQLLIGMGEAQWLTGDPGHLVTLLEASELAGETGDVSLICDASTVGYGGPPVIGTPSPERVNALEVAEVATRGEISPRRAEILTCLGAALSLVDSTRAQSCAHTAIDIARGLGDEHSLAWTLVRAAWPTNVPNNRVMFGSLVDEALERSERLADPILAWHANLLASRRARTAGDVEGMARHDEVCTRVSTQVGQPVLQFVSTQSLAVAAMVAGDLTKAEELATEAHRIGSEAGHPDALAIFAAQLGTLRMMQGDAADIVDLLVDMIRLHPNVPAYRAGLAASCVSLGRFDEAALVLEPDVRNGFSDFPMDGAWSTAMHLCAESVAALQLPEAAAVLIELVLPHADLVPASIPTCYEVFHHSLGELLTVVDELERAEQQFQLAEERHVAMQAPFFVSRTRLSFAEMLLRRDGEGDVVRARRLIGEVQQVAHERSYPVLSLRAERLGARIAG